MIDLNDSRYDEKTVKIFNGGEAGVVKNCDVRIEKRKENDKETMPLYRMIFTDETQAEINDGLFDNFDNMSEKALDFFVRKMKHLAKTFNTELPKEVSSYKELLDITMHNCHKNASKINLNIAVCYGTKDRPRRFLEVDGFWGIQNAENAVPLLSKNALTVRPLDDESKSKESGTESDGEITGEDLKW